MIGGIKNFIKNLRDENENTKKRWLIILSGITMALVISLWVGYFNLTLPRVAPPSGMAATEEIQQNENQLTHIKKTLAAGFSVLMEKINTKKSLTIKAPERNFVLENLEETLSIQLP
ncbi:MAG: hypothetical protein AAB454_01325 [Patescibacteria group bacterium]